MYRMPPLNALRAFEAAARHVSFKAAAHELNVTQSAVSRHIRLLEEHVGVRLFDRRHRHVVLTPDGAAYRQSIRAAFTAISDATDAVMAGRDRHRLRLVVPPTCAIRWLVPRLARCHARHPELSIQLTTSHDPVDFQGGEADAAIEYGAGIGSGLAGERLFGEVLVPVLSPGLAAALPEACGPADLDPQMLLHTIQRPQDWPQWFAASGLPPPPVDQGQTFQNSSLAYQAAVDGLGAAMAQLAFVLDELGTGRLVSPFALRLGNPAAYFFVTPRQAARRDAIARFRAWIAEEAAATRASGAGL